MRRVVCAAVAALLWAAPASSAAVGDGQLAGVDVAGALVTFNADGSGQRTVWSAPGHVLASPRWSSDGNRILFSDDARVVVLDLASGRLTEVAADGVAPAWSPDGTRIVFHRGMDLVTRLPDGSGEQTLPLAGSNVRAIAWSPDGEALALWTGDGLELASVDGE